MKQRRAFPFSAIVGQEEMKLALLIAAVDPSVGGVLVFGDRGTGKSTAVRALAALLPEMQAVAGCRYGCDPADEAAWCEECRGRAAPMAIGWRAGAGRGSAARRHRGPGGGRARSGARADARREGLRAGAAGPCASRLPLHRRGEPAGGPHRRSAAGCGGVRRERGGARGAERAASGAFRADRQRQSGGGRVAAATARPLRPVGGGHHAGGPADAHRGGASARCVRARCGGVLRPGGTRRRRGRGASILAARERLPLVEVPDAVLERGANCACCSARTGCAAS